MGNLLKINEAGCQRDKPDAELKVVWTRVDKPVASLWERWSYSDRPTCLAITDIREILRRHDQERKKECRHEPLTTLEERWKASRMLVELLNRHYSHLGADQREKQEIRCYLLEKAGYIPGVS